MYCAICGNVLPEGLGPDANNAEHSSVCEMCCANINVKTINKERHMRVEIDFFDRLKHRDGEKIANHMLTSFCPNCGMTQNIELNPQVKGTIKISTSTSKEVKCRECGARYILGKYSDTNRAQTRIALYHKLLS